MKIIKVTDTHYGHSEKTHKKHQRLLEAMASKIKLENIDLVIHAGDWISHNQHQLPRTWAMFRQYLGDIPILAVKGNHDLWNYDQFNKGPSGTFAKPFFHHFKNMTDQHHDWANEYKIHLLEDKPYIINDAIIFGFDGWYARREATNDLTYMHKYYESVPIDTWLNYNANRAFSDILEQIENCPYKTKMLVTHMPPFDLRIDNRLLEGMSASPGYMQFITTNFDICCFGHTHFALDKVIDDCRFINAGTDHLKNYGYDNPKYYIFEI